MCPVSQRATRLPVSRLFERPLTTRDKLKLFVLSPNGLKLVRLKSYLPRMTFSPALGNRHARQTAFGQTCLLSRIHPSAVVGRARETNTYWCHIHSTLVAVKPLPDMLGH